MQRRLIAHAPGLTLDDQMEIAGVAREDAASVDCKVLLLRAVPFEAKKITESLQAASSGMTLRRNVRANSGQPKPPALRQPLGCILSSQRLRVAGVTGRTGPLADAGYRLGGRFHGRHQEEKSGVAERASSLRPFGSSHSSCRPRTVRSRK